VAAVHEKTADKQSKKRLRVVTAHISEKPVARVPETGWSKARRRRNKGLRTCLPAVVDGGAAREAYPGPDSNIVRGED